ncbi:MAG: hypothetical protein HKO80_12705 [Flavobacteriaceae bacterium]|nr:hypothetical protein [Flavobacteriaceae bacterium]
MKKIKIIGLLMLLIGFNACQQNDDVVFVAGDTTLSFTNTFLSEYILTSAASGNVGERFTWNTPDAGVPTNFTFTLEKSLSGDFSDVEAVGVTSANEIAVTIGDLLGYASQAGLDNDPLTENPNTGQVSFRLKSVIGEGSEATYSAAQALTLVLPESTGEETAVCDFDQLFGVGAGITYTGWDWATPAVFSCTGNGVYSGNVDLQNNGGADNNFRFFTVETDWGSGQNYPFYVDAGYTIDANFEDAGDGDNNFAFVGTSGLYYLEIDTINKTITLDAPTAIGTCEVDVMYGVGAGLPTAGWDWATPVQLVCNSDGVWSGYAEFTSDGDANFRWFTVETDWGSGRNYPWYVDAGYTIDANFEDAGDGDNNFKFIGTSGVYWVTIDDVNKVISIE